MLFPDNPDECERLAEEHRRQREALLDRARELRADRRSMPRSLRALAQDIDPADVDRLEALLDGAAARGDLTAWRLGGAERGAKVSTLAHVETYLARQPATRQPRERVDGASIVRLAAQRMGGSR